MNPRPVLPTIALLLITAGSAHAQQPALDSAFLAGMRWRSIGPANMAGRVTDVEGIPSPSRTFFFAAATGGIWKTTNNGVTFRAVFDHERVISMGDLAIAPSDTMQVWAGTGEEDSRNSISPGGGIYKSTDGGLTWRLMGLERTEHIGRIVVHPANPNVVWVAAVGAAWRSNPERGLYKTTDGGQTWRLVKFVSDKAGFVDVAIDPGNPNVLLATSWERVRGPYFLQSGGPGSALWKSTDAGETWTEVSGGGLPATLKGRMTVAFSPSQPRIVYLMVEAANDGNTRKSGLYRSENGGATWTQMNTTNVRPFYYSQVVVDPADPDRVYFSSFSFSTDGGRTVRGAAQGVHVDHHAQWIDPRDPNRFITGNDGGIAITFDRGGNYLFPNTIPLGQFYAVSFDMAVPYRVCGGLQDNYSWCGPSRKSRGMITNHDWFSVSGGDGFVTAQDPRDPNIIYSESQGGNMGRLNHASGERITLQKPDWREKYREWMDSIAAIWPDTTVRPSNAVRARVAELRRRATQDSADLELRYNWNTPFFLSPHNADVFYAAANRVLKSTSRGENLQPISPDLTKRDTRKIRISQRETGGITPDITGAETYGTIVSLAESPLRRGLLYAGTDDGNVWLSPDDGRTWTDLTPKFRGLVHDTSYVSRIEPSPHEANRFYVTFDNHRMGDFRPYIFITEDGGQSFRSISGNLPAGGPDFVHVVREDLVNPNLLFAGTDVGAYVSLDRGRSWQRFMTGMPTVPVHDLKIHPRDRELIAATHGRSFMIADIAPLQQFTHHLLAANAHVFEPRPALQYGEPPSGGEFTAQLYFQVPSPNYGAEILYWVGQPAQGQARISITNARGDTVSTINGPATRGLQRAYWNYRGRATSLPLSPSERRDSVTIERRLTKVVDSLARAGRPRADLDRAVEQLRAAAAQEGGFGGRGGGGGGGERGAGAGGFVDRPAEGPPAGGGRAGGGGGGGGAGGPEGPRGGGPPGEESLQQLILRLARPAGTGGGGRGGGFGGGFGGGGATLFPRRTSPAPLADPGEYNVTVTIGGQSIAQKLRVLRGPAAPVR